jgi:hypothetical protein
MSRIADLSTLWGMFLGVGIVIVCLRAVYKLFEGGPHEA